MTRRLLWAAATLLALSGPVSAEPTHGLSAFGDLKYGPDFERFDYVNPDAPKGGRIVSEASGTYDSFNPYILKGVAAAGIGLLYDTLDGLVEQMGAVARAPQWAAQLGQHAQAVARERFTAERYVLGVREALLRACRRRRGAL